jgi:hypothetical protein
LACTRWQVEFLSHLSDRQTSVPTDYCIDPVRSPVGSRRWWPACLWVVVCAFGMLTSIFRVFEQPVCCKPDTVDIIIKAACVLHNFIRIWEGHYSSSSVNLPHHSASRQSWTQLQVSTRRPTRGTTELLDTLCNYLDSPQGEVPWQLNQL